MFEISFAQWIVWLVVGLLSGSVAGAIVTRTRQGYGRTRNLVLGMIGAVIGGAVSSLLGIDLRAGSIAVTLEDLLAALAGSLLLIFALAYFRKRRQAAKDASSSAPGVGETEASSAKKKWWLHPFAWVALVLLAIVGGVFWNVYHVATNRALMSAEAFSLRRMPLERDENGDARFQFFYVSNRQLNSDGGPLDERFSNERQRELNFGHFDTSIDPGLGLGMIIDPTDWLQNEAIEIEEIEALEQAALVEQMRKAVDASPRRSVLIVIHGYRERFPSALRKTAFISHVLDINTPVLLFDWPGNQGESLRGYRRAREVAEASGEELADTLDLLVREVGAERVAIVANSLGCQVVADAFSVLYQQEAWSDDELEIEDVVLTAPDVGHEEFGERFKQEITALAKNVTVYVSSNDRALVVSRLINRAKRLGEASFSAPADPDQFEEAVLISNLVEPGSDRVTLIDVTPVNRTRNFHNFSLETPEFFDDLFLRLTNDDLPGSRLLYPVKNDEGAVYWVLTRGR